VTERGLLPDIATLAVIGISVIRYVIDGDQR